MTSTTIGFAPLDGSNKPVPEKGTIPANVLQAATPPTFIEQYGSTIFLILCVLFATFVIQPVLSYYWDINSTAD